MRAVITGATSFVGAAAMKLMLREGHEVFAVVRPGSKKLGVLTGLGSGQGKPELTTGPGPEQEASAGMAGPARLHIVENDLSEPERLPEKIGVPCDVFCHFAWGGSGSDARRNRELQKENFLNSLNTIRAAEKLGCSRFLFSGSQAEYGLHDTQMTEETECRPNSFYGESKLRMRYAGEALCKELGLSYVHMRIFSAYGPGDHPWTLVESCLRTFRAGGTMSLGACTQKWNFLYIDDLARAVLALATAPEERLSGLDNPVFNLAGDDTRVLSEFVEEIHTLCGGRGSCVFGARGENAEGTVNLIPDIGKIGRVTGWKPEISFETGIKRTLECDND